MGAYARQFSAPRGCKQVTSSDSADVDCTKEFKGQAHLPQFGIVISGTGDLEMLYGEDVAGTVTDGDDAMTVYGAGQYLGGGCHTLGENSDADIVIAWYY